VRNFFDAADYLPLFLFRRLGNSVQERHLCGIRKFSAMNLSIAVPPAWRTCSSNSSLQQVI